MFEGIRLALTIVWIAVLIGILALGGSGSIAVGVWVLLGLVLGVTLTLWKRTRPQSKVRF